MHIGTWESKNNTPVGNKTRIPMTAEARYQKGEKSLGVAGEAVKYLGKPKNRLQGEDLQKLDTFNLLALGIDPVILKKETEKLEKQIQRQIKQEGLDQQESNQYKEKVRVNKIDKLERQTKNLKMPAIIAEAQLRQNENTKRTRTAMDMSWSPPKSFSIVHAMTEDAELKREMEQAFAESVQETLKLMEKDAKRRVRNWKEDPNEPDGIAKDENNKKIRNDHDEPTKNLIYAQYLHDTNRPTELPYSKDLFNRLENEDKKRIEGFTNQIVKLIEAGEEPTIIAPDQEAADEIDEILKEKLNAEPKVSYVIGGPEINAKRRRNHESEFECIELLRPQEEGEDKDSGKPQYISILDKDGTRKHFVRDMQLHMHTPIVNLTYDKKEKKWYALQKHDIMKKLPYFEAVASQKLASKLENLGFQIERAGSRWEISMLDGAEGREVIERFSKPTANVMKFARDFNLNNPKHRKEINQKIRQNKEEGINDMDVLKNVWTAQISSDEHQLLGNIHQDREVNFENKDTKGYEYRYADRYRYPDSQNRKKELPEHALDQMVNSESYRSAVFEPLDIQAGAIHHAVTTPAETIEKEFEKKIRKGELIRRRNEDGSEYCTSRRMIQEEHTLVEESRKLMRQGGESLQDLFKENTQQADGYEPSKFPGGDYTESQKRTLMDVLDERRGKLHFIEGDAGTGKTTVGIQIKRAIEMAGKSMVPVTVATKAKGVLEVDGYGKILKTDKEGNMETYHDEQADKDRPIMMDLKEAREYYEGADMYGSKANLPKPIENMLYNIVDKKTQSNGKNDAKTTSKVRSRTNIEKPKTLAKLLDEYENYHKWIDSENKGRKQSAQNFARRMQNQVLFVDEAGQIGTEDAVKVMKLANEFNMHVLLVGDRKQHKSVTRGNVLNTLVRYTGVIPHSIDDIRRQGGKLKEVCRHLAKKEYTSAFAMLDRELKGIVQVDQGDDEEQEETKGKKEANDNKDPNLVEDIRELKEKFVDEIVERMVNGEDPTIIIPDHVTGTEINDMLREKLKTTVNPHSKTKKKQAEKHFVDGDKEEDFTRLVSDHKSGSLKETKKGNVNSYLQGKTVIQFIKKVGAEKTKAGKFNSQNISEGAIQKGTVAKVVDINTVDAIHTYLTLECKNKRGEITHRIIDLADVDEELGKKFSLYNEKKEVKVAPGDRLLITKNIMAGSMPEPKKADKRNGIKADSVQQINNGSSYTVKDVRKFNGRNIIVLDSGNGNEIILNPELDPTHSNFANQFYMTSYGAQGSTADKGAAMVMHTPGVEDIQNLYVDLTRAAGDGDIGPAGKNNNLRVFTPSMKELLEDAKGLNKEIGPMDLMFGFGTNLNFYHIKTKEGIKRLKESLNERGLVELRKLEQLANEEMKETENILAAIAQTFDPSAEKVQDMGLSDPETVENVKAQILKGEKKRLTEEIKNDKEPGYRLKKADTAYINEQLEKTKAELDATQMQFDDVQWLQAKSLLYMRDFKKMVQDRIIELEDLLKERALEEKEKDRGKQSGTDPTRGS